MEVPMAKRAKESETGMVKVVDPLYDAPADERPASLPPPAPSRPTFRQRVRRFFDFLIRLFALVIILVVIGLGLYFGLPLLYQRYIVPLDQNTAGVSELQSRQEQTEQELADLQTKLGTLETVQNEHDQSLNELDDRVGEIETEIAARTESLETLERIQSQIQEQNEVASAELERQVDLLKSMELLSRARLFMYQSNFGLAEQDVQIARDVLATVQEAAPESLAEDLEMVVLHLDLALSNLPNFPVAASDDLDIAWQILLTGSAPTPTGAAGTPTPAGTLSATPNTTVTSTPRVTGTVQPTLTP
jgi:TolA-binding protein